MRSQIIVALCLMAISTSACGSPPAAEAPQDVPPGASDSEPVAVQVEMTDFAYEVSQETFEVGIPYRFVVTNNGAVEHEFVIMPRGVAPDPGDHEGAAQGDEAQGDDAQAGATHDDDEHDGNERVGNEHDDEAREEEAPVEGEHEDEAHEDETREDEAHEDEAHDDEADDDEAHEDEHGGDAHAALHEQALARIGNEELQPGDTATVDVTFDAAAELEFACHLPGHYEAGMVRHVRAVAAE